MSEINNESLEKAALEYTRKDGTDLVFTTIAHFKAGAEWQKEQYKDLITLMRQLLGAYDLRYPEAQQLLVGYTNEEAFNKLNNLIEKLS